MGRHRWVGDTKPAGAACGLDWNLEKSKTIGNLESQGGIELTNQQIEIFPPLSFSLGFIFLPVFTKPLIPFLSAKGFLFLTRKPHLDLLVSDNSDCFRFKPCFSWAPPEMTR